jgi:hypothetical protein
VERFNENLDEFKPEAKPKGASLLKKKDLEMIGGRAPSVKQSSLRLTVSDAKRKVSANRRYPVTDCSTVKTMDILRMLNSVNELKGKNEILQQSKLSCLAVQLTDEDP